VWWRWRCSGRAFIKKALKAVRIGFAGLVGDGAGDHGTVQDGD